LSDTEKNQLRDLEYTFAKNLVEKFSVVVSTCCGAGNMIMKHNQFDMVIVDEAGQEIEPMVLVPILRATLYPNVSKNSINHNYY